MRHLFNARNIVRLMAGVVSVSTFVLLYFGLVDLARLSGMHDARAWLYPLAIDGMVAAGYASTLVLSRSGLAYAWFVVGIGSGLSLFGQWLHASALSDWQWSGPVAAAPALSLSLVWHLLFLVVRRDVVPTVMDTPTVELESVPDIAPEPVVKPVALTLAAGSPRVSVTAPVSAPKAVRAPSDTLTKAVAVLSAARATGETVTGPVMAHRLGLANAGTASGDKSGRRWVVKAAAALEG